MREARAGGPRARRASPLAMVGSYSWPVSGSRGQVVGRPSSSSCTGSEGGPEVALRPGPAVGSDRPEAPAPLSQRPSNRRSGAWPAFGPSSARLRPVTYRETTGNEQRITQPFPLPADVHFRRSAQRFGANTPQEDDGERIYRFDDHRLDPAESPRPGANRRVGSSPCELPPDHRATATPPVVPIASVWLAPRRMPDTFASYTRPTASHHQQRSSMSALRGGQPDAEADHDHPGRPLEPPLHPRPRQDGPQPAPDQHQGGQPQHALQDEDRPEQRRRGPDRSAGRHEHREEADEEDALGLNRLVATPVR